MATPDIVANLLRLSSETGNLDELIEPALDQISAAKNALDRVALDMMHTHIDHCVAGAIRGDGGKEKVDELMDSLKRFVK